MQDTSEHHSFAPPSDIAHILFKDPDHLQLPTVSGAEVEMRVRPGDDVTLYSDCVWKTGFYTVWFRNCSHDHQPPLIISATDLMRGAFPRYTFVWNPSKHTHDLLVKNVAESDLGLYYCAVHEKKILDSEDVYHHGNRISRLSFLGSKEGREQLTGDVFQVGGSVEHQCERSINGELCFHSEVYYTSLKSVRKSD
ncbi:hypothetical protein MHYP_G00250080 [Metynnis hypsauchen]